jgi:hypothetical protein
MASAKQNRGAVEMVRRPTLTGTSTHWPEQRASHVWTRAKSQSLKVPLEDDAIFMPLDNLARVKPPWGVHRGS